MSMNPLNELYSRKGRDPHAWLNFAKRLKLSADLILKNLSEVSEDSSVSQDLLDKRLAFMESYMMLIGFAFENLLKGIDIGRNPSLVKDSELNISLWNVRGGHGISTFARRIANLSAEEIDLFKRLEEFIFWAGRYPISKLANTFSNAIEPKNLMTYRSTDPALVDRLFKQFAEILIEERRNQHKP